jgi:hypothetical protein
VERNGDHDRLSSALVSLEAAQNHLDHMITAEDCASFVDAWRDDLQEWQMFSSGVNNVESTRDAMEFLQLSAWTRANGVCQAKSNGASGRPSNFASH